MGSSIFPLVSSSTPFPSSSQQERGVAITLPSPSVAVSMATDRGGDQLHAAPGGGSSAGVVFSHSVQKHSPPKPPVPCLRLEIGSRAGLGAGVAVGNGPVAGTSVMAAPQHCLTLPTLHMSAPASPRQLSAPPSPHPFSAPPSPRHLSLHQNMTPPPQYMSPNSSALQLSAPPSLHLLPASPSRHSCPVPTSPHTFSAPSSPRLLPGQHSLTPPPQYTSTPPSPRQLSAPSSPHIFSPPRSSCATPGSHQAVPPQSSQPVTHHFPVGSSSHQLPGCGHAFPSPTPVPHGATPWIPSSHAGSSGDGYTCFTYNFVTPLPVETSPVLPSLHSHTATVRYPIRDCTATTPLHPNLPDSIGEGRPGVHGMHRPVIQGTLSSEHRGMPRASGYAQGGEAAHSTFTSRTDIQANIWWRLSCRTSGFREEGGEICCGPVWPVICGCSVVEKQFAPLYSATPPPSWPTLPLPYPTHAHTRTHTHTHTHIHTHTHTHVCSL